MRGKAVHMEPGFLKYVPDHFKTHEMCNEAIEKAQWQLPHVLDQYKT